MPLICAATEAENFLAKDWTQYLADLPDRPSKLLPGIVLARGAKQPGRTHKSGLIGAV
jgi:hypothetical protein